MAHRIVILDDEPDRIAVMMECLAARLPGDELVSFDNAVDMIDWLLDNLTTASLICLDHDLGPNRRRAGEVFDPGTGRDVADFLATRPASCPVVIHTTNSLAAPGMVRVLGESGWTVTRVVPYEDTQWIGEDWIEAVAAALEAHE